jgi:hypothetical protein
MGEPGLTLGGGRLQTQGSDALRSRMCESTLHVGQRVLPGTPLDHWASSKRSGITSLGKRMEPPKSNCPSRRAASNTRLDSLVFEKIIGHRMRTARRIDWPRFGVELSVRSAQGTFALLLHEPSREHGGSVFFQPGIEQLTNLFAEIGSVTESREFVTLEGVSRGRQEKIPRRFGLMAGHKSLLRGQLLGTVTL